MTMLQAVLALLGIVTPPQHARKTPPPRSMEELEPRQLMSGLNAAVQTTTLLSDNFNSSQINASLWSLPSFYSGGTYYGRTQQRVEENVPLSSLTVKNGAFILKDDSYNPTDTNGNLSFYGTEIVSNQSFSIPSDGGCLDLKVRMKINSTVGGFVVASFLYQDTNPTEHTEVDTNEAVSNQAADGTNNTETNYYVDAPFDSGSSVFSALPNGGKLTDYHTYESQVFKDHIVWLVDGVQIRTINVTMPANEPLQIHVNAWTPDGTWPAAYNSSIQAAATAAQNQEFTASVDSVLLTQVGPAPDKTAPSPNPSTWAQKPTAADNGSITMIAAPAVDPSGVEYYFHNLTVKGHDSGWQTSSTYTDTGLNASTKYSYQVRTRDQSPAQNTGKYSASASATTLPITVTSATVSLNATMVVQNKSITGSGSITGTGTGNLSVYKAVRKPGSAVFQKVGSDVTVKMVNGNAAIPNFTGLPTNVVGTYTVVIVIDSGANKGVTSSTAGYTVIPPTPTPNPSTWAVKPTTVSNTTITMTATTASDPAGVEYFFHNLTDPTHDSGWQSSPTFTDTGLNASTKYTYEVRTRDQSVAQNTGKYSVAASATTLAQPPVTVTGVTISLNTSSVVQGGTITGTGTLTGSPDGQATFHFAVEQPGSSTFVTVGNGGVVNVVNGTATLPNFTGLPTSGALGNYSVEAVVDNGPSVGMTSNVLTYTVTAPPPGITITSVPKYGAAGNASGKAVGVDTSKYGVVVYIHIHINNAYADGWWGPKPYWNQPITALNADGTWSVNIDTGGVDADADQITAFLVPLGTSVPSLGLASSLPSSLSAYPSATVTRS